MASANKGATESLIILLVSFSKGLDGVVSVTIIYSSTDLSIFTGALPENRPI